MLICLAFCNTQLCRDATRHSPCGCHQLRFSARALLQTFQKSFLFGWRHYFTNNNRPEMEVFTPEPDRWTGWQTLLLCILTAQRLCDTQQCSPVINGKHASRLAGGWVLVFRWYSQNLEKRKKNPLNQSKHYWSNQCISHRILLTYILYKFARVCCVVADALLWCSGWFLKHG